MMARKEPLVSIALCTYNGERYLAKQLDSLLAQDYPNLEIIIVDDCSTDKTLMLLEAYKVQNRHLTIVKNTQNIGFNANFKKAMDHCNGSYIAIADQDDIWHPKKISTMVNAIGSNLLLYHNSTYIDERGGKLGTSTLSHHRFVKGNCSSQLWYYNCVSGHACLLHRSLLTLSSPFPAHFYYDWWLAYTAACTAKISYLNAELVEHRLHSESSTQKDTAQGRALRIEHFNLFLRHPLTSEANQTLLRTLVSEYEKLRYQNFSLKLFSLLLAHAATLFYVRKKSLFSRIKFILRECSK